MNMHLGSPVSGFFTTANKTLLYSFLILTVFLEQAFAGGANVYSYDFPVTYNPLGIAVNSRNEIWITKTNPHGIEKYDQQGNLLLQFGSGGIREYQFSQPRGIAVDSQDNIYIADFDPGRVQKYDDDGNFILMWGWGVATGADAFEICYANCTQRKPPSSVCPDGDLPWPYGIEVDSLDRVWVRADCNRIQVFDKNGNFLFNWHDGTGGSISRGWLALDADTNVFVPIGGSSPGIQKFDASGNLLTQWAKDAPSAIEVDYSGNVYVVGNWAAGFWKYDNDGNLLANFGRWLFNQPSDLAFGPDNRLYAVDRHNAIIRVFAPSTDAVFANDNRPNEICENDGTVGFTCADVSADTNATGDVAVGDIDADGFPDLVFANVGTRNRACLNDGANSFTCSDISTDLFFSRGVALADLNGDANLDAVFANDDEQPDRVCLGDGAGNFSCGDLSAARNFSLGVALGDVNGDGNTDAVVATDGEPNRVCLGDGAGNFSCADVSADRFPSNDVALGDLNRDGKLDAVFANVNEPNQQCLGDGAGGFTCSDMSGDILPSTGVAIGEVNGDGYLDAVFANDLQPNRVCLNDNIDSFACVDVSADQSSSWGVALADLNSDRDLDAVFANQGSYYNRVCLGDGAGGFTCSDVSTVATLSNSVALSKPPDFDLDDIPDASDNCPTVANNGQANADNDGFGDTCDECPNDVSNRCNNVAPQAYPQSVTTDEDVPLAITLDASDADNDALDYEITSNPANGILSGAAPDLIYTPNVEWSGSDSLTFVADDGLLQSAPATVSITVNAVNDPPVAQDQSVQTDEDTEVDINLVATDVDDDDLLLDYRVVTPPEHGTVQAAACEFGGPYADDENTLLLAHFDGGYDGVQGETGTPTGAGLVDGRYGQGLHIDAAGKLTFPGTDNLLPASGAVEYWVKPDWGSPDGQHRDFFYGSGGMVARKDGADNFRFLMGADDSEAYKHHSLSYWNAGEWRHFAITWRIPGEMKTYVDGELRIAHAATAQDLRPLSETLTVGYNLEGVIDELRISDTPRFGYSTTCFGGVLRYVPDPDYAGPDSFIFVANDGNSDSNLATVMVEVQEVNEAPVAADLSVSTNEDEPVLLTLRASDSDGDPLEYTVIARPEFGNLSGSAPALTYAPAENWYGTDSFTFRANDGMADSETATVIIEVASVNDAPVVDVGPDLAGVQGEAVQFSAGFTDPDDEDGHQFDWNWDDGTTTLILNPLAPLHSYQTVGEYEVTLTVTDIHDTAGSDTLIVTITNAPPVADDQALSTIEATPLGITLTGTDPGNDSLSYTIDTPPAHGSLSGAPPGVTYTPAPGFTGDDGFSFTVSDGAGGSDTGYVTIDVVPANYPPVVNAGADLSVDEGTTVEFSGSFSDPDAGDTHTIKWDFGDGSGEMYDLGLAPSHIYADNGIYTVLLTVDDGTEAVTDQLVVTVFNVAPVADDQSLTTEEDMPLDIILTGSDQGDDELTFEVVSFPNLGELTELPPASLRYTPATDRYGTDTIEFRVTDDDGDSDTGVVTIEITPVYDPPRVTAYGPYSTNEGEPVTLRGRVVLDVHFDDGTNVVSWDFGDGVQGTGEHGSADLTHVYEQPGDYVATLIVKEPEYLGGLTYTNSTDVSVADVPPVALATISDPTPPYGVPVIFDGSGSYAASTDRLTHTWDFGEGLIGSGVAVRQTYPVTGPRTATLTVADDDGNTTSTTMSLTVVDPAPGTIVTLVGSEYDEHGPASAASLLYPYKAIRDAENNLYVADYGNSRVMKVSAGTGHISTFAGTGISGWDGDGGLAVNAMLDWPVGLAADAEGNVYIATRTRVRRVDVATGIITTVAGGGSLTADGVAATEARLVNPRSVVLDAAGSLFIADTGAQRIRRVDGVSGKITTVAGGGGSYAEGVSATAAYLDSPQGVAVDTTGNLFIAETGHHRIRRVDKDTGLISTVAGTGLPRCYSAHYRHCTTCWLGHNHCEYRYRTECRPLHLETYPAMAEYLYYPSDVAVDSAGFVYIADRSNRVVRRLDVDAGRLSTVAGGGPSRDDNIEASQAYLPNPNGVSLDFDDNLYIADESDARIRRVLADTGMIDSVAGRGGSSLPSGLARDNDGNLLFTDVATDQVRRLDVGTGEVTTMAGGGSSVADGIDAREARLVDPNDLAVDTDNNVYIADSVRSLVRQVNAETGKISTVAGGGSSLIDNVSATDSRLYIPRGVATDAGNNLYIADTYHHRIRRVDGVSGEIQTVGSLSYPEAVEAGTDGYLYIAQRNYHRVWKLNVATGILSPKAGNGQYSSSWTGDGGLALNATLGYPESVALNTTGDIYIAARDRVRRVDAGTELISTVAGGGYAREDGITATSAYLNYPKGVAVDEAGNLYIAESNSRRIRKVMAAPPGVTAQLTVQPETISEGDGLTLDASGSSSPNGSLLGFDFDLDRDGTYDRHSTTAVIEVGWSELAAIGFTPGRHVIAVRVPDEYGAAGVAFAEWVLVESSSETPPSTGSEPVTVTPEDLGTGETSAEVSFETVTSGGLTTVETVPAGDATALLEQGSGFALGSDTFVNISTTAEFEGLVTICLDYDDTVDETFLELAHLVETGKLQADGLTCNAPGGCWETVTSPGYPDTENNVICGEVASLSPFALVTTLVAHATGTPVPVGEPVTGQAFAPVSVTVTGGAWSWGDGTVSDAIFDEETRTLSGEHVYATPGVYSVGLEFTHNGVTVARAETDYVVVVDPEGGFVTGGGWIDSPAGAYAPNPELTGKATFGFVSKYRKGATTPSGETEFRFRAAGLEFHSTSYEWLVVAGAKAQFKGEGTVNGAGNYGFMLTAIDEALTPSTDTDMFRIKIWDRDADDAVIYDNNFGDADDSDPSTQLGGGSIVIHKEKGK